MGKSIGARKKKISKVGTKMRNNLGETAKLKRLGKGGRTATWEKRGPRSSVGKRLGSWSSRTRRVHSANLCCRICAPENRPSVGDRTAKRFHGGGLGAGITYRPTGVGSQKRWGTQGGDYKGNCNCWGPEERIQIPLLLKEVRGLPRLHRGQRVLDTVRNQRRRHRREG